MNCNVGRLIGCIASCRSNFRIPAAEGVGILIGFGLGGRCAGVCRRYAIGHFAGLQHLAVFVDKRDNAVREDGFGDDVGNRVRSGCSNAGIDGIFGTRLQTGESDGRTSGFLPGGAIQRILLFFHSGNVHAVGSYADAVKHRGRILRRGLLRGGLTRSGSNIDLLLFRSIFTRGLFLDNANGFADKIIGGVGAAGRRCSSAQRDRIAGNDFKNVRHTIAGDVIGFSSFKTDQGFFLIIDVAGKHIFQAVLYIRVKAGIILQISRLIRQQSADIERKGDGFIFICVPIFTIIPCIGTDFKAFFRSKSLFRYRCFIPQLSQIG